MPALMFSFPGRQAAGEVSHQPRKWLLLVAYRHFTFTFPASEHHCL